MIRDKIINYFTVNPDLHALFIFDPMGSIRPEIEGVKFPEGYVFHFYDNRPFYVKYMLTHDWKDKHVILFFNDPTPGAGDDNTRFPLLGELRANMEFCTEDYQAFMQAKGVPERFAGFIREHLGLLQQSRTEKILEGYYTPESLSEDVLVRGLLSAYLKREELCDWTDILTRVLILHGPDTEPAKLGSFVSLLKKDPAVARELSSRFVALSGQAYDINKADGPCRIAEALKYNAITHNLSVTPGDSYKSYKLTGMDSRHRALAFVETVRARDIDKKFRDAFSSLASGIHESRIIEWYGPDAEYMTPNDRLCAPIIEAITGDVRTSPDKAVERAHRLSCRLSQDSSLQTSLSFITYAGLSYDRYNKFGTFRLKTPGEYIFRYKADFFLIDQAYRHAIGAYKEVIAEGCQTESIRQLKMALDTDYGNWSGDFNREWLRCLNESGEQMITLDGVPHQHTFFRDNISERKTKVVVIISDAFRYEVADELLHEFGENRNMAKLSYALAMLPTETKYCKNALLPHENLNFTGNAMITDGKSAADTASRQKQLQAYVPDGACYGFRDFWEKNEAEQREICKHSVVYIYHDVIDDTCHEQPHKVPQTCAEAVSELHKLVSRLHNTLNVTRVFITSDHGFLYNDIEFADKDKQRIIEDTVEKGSRYYITNNPQEASKAGIGISKYPLESVSAMNGRGCYVAVPESTNRLYCEGGGYEFAHGGASLQELVIPVLESSYMRDIVKDKVGVLIISGDLKMQASTLTFDLIQTESLSAEKTERTIRIGVWHGNSLVTEEKELKLDRISSDPNNRLFHVVLRLTSPTMEPLLTLKVYDVSDALNPLEEKTVKNMTLIEQDF